jgi:hypothetical protein
MSYFTKCDKTDYSLFIKGNGKEKNILLESIIHLLPFAFIDNEGDKNELYFKAKNVSSLQDFIKNMNYDQCVNLIGFISKQIEYLTKYQFTFIGFDLQDIIVVDEYIFFVSSTQYLYPIINNNITFYIPFKKPYFASPELLEFLELPGHITSKSCYYGIGVLVVYCLLGEYLLKGNDIKTDSEIDIILKPIYLTKMYWFLKRSLKLLEKDRYLLFN